MNYFVMTKRQKKFLEKTFACLNISVEDLMKITKIEEIETQNKQLSDRVEFLEKALKVSNDAIVALNGNLTDLSAKITKMQTEAVWGGSLDET